MYRHPNEILIPYNKLLHKVIDSQENYVAAEGEIFLRRYKPEKEKKALYDVCVGTSYGEHMRIATFHEDEPTFFVICEREKLPNPGNPNQLYIVDEDLAYWNGEDYTYIHTSINGRLTDIEDKQEGLSQQVNQLKGRLSRFQTDLIKVDYFYNGQNESLTGISSIDEMVEPGFYHYITDETFVEGSQEWRQNIACTVVVSRKADIRNAIESGPKEADIIHQTLLSNSLFGLVGFPSQCLLERSGIREYGSSEIAWGPFTSNFYDKDEIAIMIGDAVQGVLGEGVGEAYDTLVEIQNFLKQGDANAQNLIASVNQIFEELGQKVDVEQGKGLSTNDFTNALKLKLEGLSKEIYVGEEEPTDQNIKVWVDLTQNDEDPKLIVPTITTSKEGGVTTLTITDVKGVKTATIHDGENGKNGIGVSSIVQTTDGENHLITITLTNGESTTFTVRDGSRGIDGAAGQDGADGFSPVISAEKKDKETILTITDIDGSKEIAISDGVNGQNGADGVSPIIELFKNGKDTTLRVTDVTGIKDVVIRDGADGVVGKDGKDGSDGKDGADGLTPYIAENGNWWIGTTDTGVKAKGTNGTNGTNGIDGKDGVNGKDGTNGVDGVGISNVEITNNELIATLTSGTVINLGNIKGVDGKDGKDGANGVNGTDGKDGVNGADGLTPYIAENGNWWIGTTDMGVKAKGSDGINGTNGKDGANGKDGKDGIGIKSIEQTTTSTEDNGINIFTITLTNDVTSEIQVINGSKGADGAPGAKGDDGYTPQKGVDYFTDEDIQLIVDAVYTKILEQQEG